MKALFLALALTNPAPAAPDCEALLEAYRSAVRAMEESCAVDVISQACIDRGQTAARAEASYYDQCRR